MIVCPKIMSVLLLIVVRIAPIFIIMGLGFLAFSLKWIDEPFVRKANTITYRIALPALIFLSVLHADFLHDFPLRELIAFTAALLGTTLLGYVAASVFHLSPPRRASFVQGSIRGNMAIVGLAIFQQVLGESSLHRAAVYLAFFMLIHNLVGLTVLSGARIDDGAQKNLARELLRTLWKSASNPLMIAIYLGGIGSILKVHLPAVLLVSLDYVRNLAMPLALMGIGASLRVYYQDRHLPLASAAAALKLLVMPAIAISIGLLLGLQTVPLLMVGVLAGSPAAVATYALADGMGADRDTAGSTILVTHVASIVTIAIIIALIRGGL